MLWYYGRDLDNESELLSGLQEKACLAQESCGWEFAVVGLLDVNVYIRLATVGLQLAILPRGETLCAHTVTQPPGSVFLLPNMMEDWRFRDSPYVELGGLIAYAGVPLRMQHESGECIGLGSICVASAASQPPLSKQQQQTLARLADWVVADIVQCTRARRQRERHQLADLIASVENVSGDHVSQDSVLNILRIAYPHESISIQSSSVGQFETNSRFSGLPSDLKNGLWEDTAYIDEFIANSNHSDTPKDKVVRFISANCESKLGPSILVVATKDFRRIFDDVDAWFVQTCASMLTQIWQKCLLSEAIRAKERFLRGMSHQLRTPIHGILGAAELLTEDLKAITLSESARIQPALAEIAGFLADIRSSSLYLDTISTAGRELMSTVNSLITLNRWADVAVAERNYAVHDISELEFELMKGISDAAISTGSTASIFFHCDLPEDSRGLRTDLNLLRDSVLPLIINAIQSTPEGAVTVTSSKQPETQTFVIDVEDTGCGIQLDDQGRIFELYEKVGEHSTGAGLGLTLATKFSTLLHGSIDLVSSQVNRGSHFRAIFRDVAYTASAVPSYITTSSLEHLPLSFHQVGAESHMSSNLAKFLIRSGFASSGSNKDYFTILEYCCDLKQNHSYISSVPPEQVVVCLVPTSVDSESLEPLPNVLYASGPFSTVKLLSILQGADSLAMRIHNPAKRLVRSNNTLAQIPTPEGAAAQATPSAESYSTADEGYDSLDGSLSPFSNSDLGLNWRLPCTHQSDDPAIWKAFTTPSAPARSAKPLTLVVDDNIVNLRILEMYCKKRGLPCLSAVDGKQAVEIFSKRHASHAAGDGDPIELVLMDLQMPVCDGINATQEMRSLEKQHGWNSSILFIVTGQDSEMDREAASAAGADDYLVKPIGMRVLDSGLKRYFPAFTD